MKKLISLLLTVAMLLGMTAAFVQAADSEEAAMSEIQVYNGGQSLNCLSVNGRVQEFNYVYYMYTSSDGSTKEIPTYCVNPVDPGVPQKVPAGSSIKYIVKERESDPKVMGIVANGYPTKSLAELGLNSAIEGYYATKVALWCYIIPGWDISTAAVNPAADPAQAQRVLAAAKQIYQYGTGWTQVLTASLTTTAEQAEAAPTTIDGQQYKAQTFKVHSDTFVKDYSVSVAFADPSAVPSGTRIVDMDNHDITTVKIEGSGSDFNGRFKVLYPLESVEGQTGSVQFSLKATSYQYGVFYASCAETDAYGTVQNYICDTDPTAEVAVSGISKYSDSPDSPDDPDEPDTPSGDTQLQIVKLEEGTRTPLEGAIFEVKGPGGDVLGTFSSGADGKVTIPIEICGLHVVTEVTPPREHLLSADPTQTVTVTYGNTATVTFENAPFGNLRVEKVSDKGNHLAGVTVQVKHIESGTTYSAQTNAAGVATFDQLRPGAYEVSELAGIEGWIADTDTVKTVNVIKGEMATVTLTNKELPGLRILKFDRESMMVMANVTFEITKDGESLGTFQTNQMGEILLTNLQPGTYTAVETGTGDSAHILVTTPQTVELHAGDGIRDMTFFNDLKPGISLVKVDSANPTKVIPNAKFRIEAVDGSFGPEEFTTGQDGTIDLSELDTGAYVVTEISCPGYVIDEAQRIIELHANQTAEFVFTNSIRPSLRLIKYSSDGTPLRGVSFQLTKIEDGSHYLDRVTDANGEILWEDLDPGVYSLKETYTVSDHILDLREFHVELFPGKTSTITIENQKRPNLTVVKRDADTGEPIADTIFTVRAADGHSVDEIKTDATGKATLVNLLPGVYEVSEKSVPSDYLLDAPSQLVTLYPNRDHTVYFENHKKPSLTIMKVDAASGDLIYGAEFHIWYASNNTTTGEINDLGTFQTDFDGLVTLTGLRDGWYKVQETEAAAGYSIKDTGEQTVYISGGENKLLVFENIPLSAIVIWKFDSVAGTAISGATFTVRYLGGESGTGGTAIGTYTTGVNGAITVTGLKPGTYVIEVRP